MLAQFTRRVRRGGVHSSLLWARVLFQAIADSRLTLQPANLRHISGWNKTKRPGDPHELLHLSTSLSLPLPPERKGHVQSIMINVYNTPLQNKGLSTAVVLICQDRRSTSPFSLPWDSDKTKLLPIQNCFYTPALSILPITLISDPPSCHSACLILQGL